MFLQLSLVVVNIDNRVGAALSALAALKLSIQTPAELNCRTNDSMIALS